MTAAGVTVLFYVSCMCMFDELCAKRGLMMNMLW